LDSGATISADSISDAFSTFTRSIADIVLERFDLNMLSKEQLNASCKDAAIAGWADIVNLLAKKGCDFELAWNDKESMTLPVANIIARLHYSEILSLKYLSADVVNNAVPNEELYKMLASYPEEMKALFHEKEFWRWTLFVKDEDRRNRYLQLYRAIYRAQRSTNNKTMRINIGNVEFAVSIIRQQVFNVKGGDKEKNVGLLIWPGKLKECPVTNSYEITFYTKGDPRVFVMPRQVSFEYCQEVPDNILESIGWPIEDTYIFLIICYYAFPASEKKDYTGRISQLKVKKFFCQEIIDEHVEPPLWYEKFLQEIYGIKLQRSRIRTRAARNPGSLLSQEDDNSMEAF
jgi:hypothetical protein